LAAEDPTSAELLDMIAAARAELAELRRRLRNGQAAPAAKPEPRKLRFTKSTVRAVPAPRDRAVTYWDRDVTGLGLRISPTGRKTYFLQARTKVGRAVKLTLGNAAKITAEQAKAAAGKHLAAIELGRDPAAELRTARKAERERREAPTVDRLWELFAADYLPAKRERTRRAYGSWYKRHIAQALGRIKVADVTAEHVERLHRSVTSATGASTANRCHAVLSAMLTFAVKRRLVVANVARGAVPAHREDSRERTLSDAELLRLVGHLAGSPALEARLVEFLLATGCRKGEALALRWSDLAGSWWTVPAMVSKSGKQVRRPLNEVAQAILAKVPRRGTLVFSGMTEGRIGAWWRRERQRITLVDVRLHDLRHAAASLALNAGIPLAAVGKMLGHGVNSASMTARYSHIADEQLAAASAAVAERLRLLRDAGPAGSA
jgi:integrase